MQPRPEPGKWLWFFPLGGNGTCGTSGWRAGWGRGRAWGQLEVPRNPAFCAHTLCAPLCFLARVGTARRDCGCWGIFHPHCGVAITWVPGASLSNWLFLMAGASFSVLEDGFFLFAWVFLPHGETLLTWGILPFPGRWMGILGSAHSLCSGSVAPGVGMICDAGVLLGEPPLGLPGRALPPGVYA